MDHLAFVRSLYEDIRRAAPEKTALDALGDLERIVERLVAAAASLKTAAAV